MVWLHCNNKQTNSKYFLHHIPADTMMTIDLTQWIDIACMKIERGTKTEWELSLLCVETAFALHALSVTRK